MTMNVHQRYTLCVCVMCIWSLRTEGLIVFDHLHPYIYIPTLQYNILYYRLIVLLQFHCSFCIDVKSNITEPIRSPNLYYRYLQYEIVQ